jgi:hypothetical protein
MSFISIGTFTIFLTFIKNSGEPSNMYGCVNTESADAPPLTIFNAISTGSVISLILPNAGDENFTSVIIVACSDFAIIFSKSVPEFGSDSLMS